jgi:hypothetical protein
MNYINIIILGLLLLASLGGNMAKNPSVDSGNFTIVLDTIDSQITNLSIKAHQNYTDTSLPKIERGVSLVISCTVGLIGLLQIEAVTYGYNNPNIDYNILIILFFIYIILTTIPLDKIKKIVNKTGIIMVGIIYAAYYLIKRKK